MTGIDAPPVDVARVADILRSHTSLYRNRPPVYQTEMLNSLSALWLGRHERLLDIGGGTGVMAEAMQALLPVGRVEAVDVADRFFPTLTVPHQVYDGRTLPFADASMDAASLNNVMHHVPIPARDALMREIRRVVAGPVYIKDHVAASWADHKRLWALDSIGNIPFGGQIDADYLSMAEWSALAAGAGYRIGAKTGGTYRRGLMALLFPNRLEMSFRLDPV